MVGAYLRQRLRCTYGNQQSLNEKKEEALFNNPVSRVGTYLRVGAYLREALKSKHDSTCIFFFV